MRIAALLGLVNLDASILSRRPHQLSGGQLQRVMIARSLACNPRLLVLDEPTSALDWLVRREILNLLAQLRSEQNLTYLLVTHDMGAVKGLCDQIAIMYRGAIVERGDAKEILGRPQHPYTRILLSSVLDPTVGVERKRLRLRRGALEDESTRPGCPFYLRCPVRIETCAEEPQPLRFVGSAHEVACMRAVRERDFGWLEESEGT